MIQTVVLGAGGEGLSTGELRRVAVARALLRIDCGGGQLLVLDEPTAGLDTDTELAVIDGLRSIGVGALVVSHRGAVLAAADRVVELPVAGAGGWCAMRANQLLHDRGDRGRLLGAIGLGALASACGVALMGTSAWLLSRAAEHPPVMYLMVAIVAVRAFGLGKACFRYAERLVGHDLALRLQAALRLETYRALARSTWVGRRSGDLLSRVVNDVEAVQDLVVRAVVPMASAGLVAVATGIVLTVLSPAAGVAGERLCR